MGLKWVDKSTDGTLRRVVTSAVPPLFLQLVIERGPGKERWFVECDEVSLAMYFDAGSLEDAKKHAVGLLSMWVSHLGKAVAELEEAV